LTDNFDIYVEEVASLFKKRWEIKMLFKKMEQNLYFGMVFINRSVVVNSNPENIVSKKDHTL